MSLTAIDVTNSLQLQPFSEFRVNPHLHYFVAYYANFPLLSRKILLDLYYGWSADT
jgi:hypothetical protein